MQENLQSFHFLITSPRLIFIFHLPNLRVTQPPQYIQSNRHTLKKSMSTTLSALNLPSLPLRPQSKLHTSSSSSQTPLKSISSENTNTHQKLTLTKQEISPLIKSCSLPLTTLALPFILDAQDALAVEGKFGLLEGRTAALIHPAVMGGLFVYTLWAGYLGWQWRRIRTIQNEINELKKQVRPVAVTPDGSSSDIAAPPSPVETKIKQLTEEKLGKPKPSVECYGGGSQRAQSGRYAKPKERDFYKKSSDSEESGVRVITIAGENKGAVMELGYSPRRRGSSLNSPHKIKSDGELSEGNLSGNEERLKLQAKAKHSVPMHAFMNSTVQSINNSIVFNSTCSHHDPGVHLSLTRKPMNGHGFQLKDNAKGKNFVKEKGQWFSE